ncbi:MAG: alpha/beta fold hydrolase [Candidatus Methylacidiphilales bacterium]|nr:alpha/beta hydrolase [Candidatus Methylacidiphilales bacterium]
MERLISQESITLWSIRTGSISPSAIPVLLFNGGPGCSDYLAPLADMLTEPEDVHAHEESSAGESQVIRFEPRGCGRSTWRGPYDLETTIADAERVREAWGIERWIVAGHSAGVDFAMAYGIAHPARTLGLIGLSGGRIVNDRDWSAAYKARQSAAAARGATPEDNGGITFSADPEVNRVGNLSWRAYIKRPGLLRDIAAIPFPCVFINAGEDIRDNWPTVQLAQLIPIARYVEIPGAAHYSWITHAPEVRRHLRDAMKFIQQHPAASR